jgi:hypothetical protein
MGNTSWAMGRRRGQGRRCAVNVIKLIVACIFRRNPCASAVTQISFSRNEKSTLPSFPSQALRQDCELIIWEIFGGSYIRARFDRVARC